MKKQILAIVLACGLAFVANSAPVFAQSTVLLNEVEANPANGDTAACQYVEVRGKINSTIENIYFVSVEGDSFGNGTINVSVNLSGQKFGDNGLLIISSPDACVNREFPSFTTQVTDPQLAGGLGLGSESFLLIRSTTPIFAGADLDADDDGTPESLPADAVIVDGFGWNDGFDLDRIYGGVVLERPDNTPPGSAPQAATRFLSNNTPLSAAAWYYGDLEGDSTTTTYSTIIRGANFPQGGALTPGKINLPYPVAPFVLCVSPINNGFEARFGYANANSTVVTLPVGQSNRFSPAPINRGQVTDFQPGVKLDAFRVRFDGNPLTWTIASPDGAVRTARASRNTRRCH